MINYFIYVLIIIIIIIVIIIKASWFGPPTFATVVLAPHCDGNLFYKAHACEKGVYAIHFNIIAFFENSVF